MSAAPAPTAAPTVGSDGAVWFGSYGLVERVARDGRFHIFRLPDPAADVQGITTGADGAMWFVSYDDGTGLGADDTGDTAWRLQRNGTLTQYTLPDGSGLSSIVATPNGQIWIGATPGHSRFFYRLTVPRPAGGWAAAPVPTAHISTRNSRDVIVNIGCRGMRGLYCNDAVSIAGGGRTLAHAAIVVPGSGTTTIEIPIASSGRQGGNVTATIRSRDFLGRVRTCKATSEYDSV